ncbi:MAG TPA: IclR family transcriptional regulator [Povalibacter sp.]|uniref:IclR family transcriptional regulator n=1 Tax=Povalibacter sp. TaxID=1962978 RepID=UPI002BC8DD7C|nr:IclR family transcriptional regulator [Povalibacter sp.]HMN43668.1 IclR family transcriptional regulator [Povalibacter sp.]
MSASTLHDEARIDRDDRLSAERAKPAVRAVAVSIAILRHLALSRRPMGVNAIARAVGCTPSACFNILKTMAAEHFVEFDRDTKAYSLGRGVAALARHALDPNAMYGWMRERIEQLADDWALTIGLWRVQKTSVLLVGYATGFTSTRIHLTIGQRVPLLLGATGRCIAAACQLADADIAEQFAALRWDEPVALDRYLAEVAQTRQTGWGVDDGHQLRGVTSIATAVTDDLQQVRFCLSAHAFNGQLSDSARQELAGQMLNASAWASERIGSSCGAGFSRPSSESG